MIFLPERMVRARRYQAKSPEITLGAEQEPSLGTRPKRAVGHMEKQSRTAGSKRWGQSLQSRGAVGMEDAAAACSSCSVFASDRGKSV